MEEVGRNGLLMVWYLWASWSTRLWPQARELWWIYLSTLHEMCANPTQSKNPKTKFWSRATTLWTTLRIFGRVWMVLATDSGQVLNFVKNSEILCKYSIIKLLIWGQQNWERQPPTKVKRSTRLIRGFCRSSKYTQCSGIAMERVIERKPVHFSIKRDRTNTSFTHQK